MVKKVTELRSIGELKLSTRSQACLRGRYPSIDEMVWCGRVMAYKVTGKLGRSATELVYALDKAGFIRHDINAGSFRLNLLYHAVYQDPDITYRLNDFYKKGDYYSANECYESFKNPTNDQIETVKEALKTCLSDEEYTIIARYSGLEDGKPQSCDITATELGISQNVVRQIKADAINKLAKEHALPAILEPLSEQGRVFDTTMKELLDIRKNPIFKREAELRQKMYLMSKSPFNYAKKAQSYLDGTDFTNIEEIGLSLRTYNVLRLAKLLTVADIVNLPPEDWGKIRNLGPKSLEELKEKIHAIGHTDFLS